MQIEETSDEPVIEEEGVTGSISSSSEKPKVEEIVKSAPLKWEEEEEKPKETPVPSVTPGAKRLVIEETELTEEETISADASNNAFSILNIEEGSEDEEEEEPVVPEEQTKPDENEEILDISDKVESKSMDTEMSSSN